MNSETIYIVVAAGGEHDDAWTTNIAASFDKAKAEGLLLSEKENYERRVREMDAFAAIEKQWRDEQPEMVYENFLNVPKWSPGLSENEITNEMRNERTKIQIKNNKIQKRNDERGRLLDEAYQEFRTEYFMALGYDKDDPLITYWSSHVSPIYFHIEEVPII